MRFLFTLVSATALFASGISAFPLDGHGAIKIRADQSSPPHSRPASPGATHPKTEKGKSKVPTEDYEIDEHIASWMRDRKFTEYAADLCTTEGGWEGWAQVELEHLFKKEINVKKGSIREKTAVYTDAKKADLVFPKTKDFKGMIIELKCENSKSNKGKDLGPLVKSDIEKATFVKKEFHDYTYVVLAMAYTDPAEVAITALGLHAIPRAEVEVEEESSSKEEEDGTPGGATPLKKALTMRAYKKQIEHKQDPIDELTTGMGNQSLEDKSKDKDDKEKSKKHGKKPKQHEPTEHEPTEHEPTDKTTKHNTQKSKAKEQDIKQHEPKQHKKLQKSQKKKKHGSTS